MIVWNETNYPMRACSATLRSCIKCLETAPEILYALFEEERGVGEIAGLLGMTMSAISHQLRILKGAKLVKYRREGKTIFYSLADDHVRTIFAQGMDHICE